MHHDFSNLDAFPDGNGRTARLLADLVLLKAGHAPAYYTDIADYFARGSITAQGSRASVQRYFHEIVERGDRAMKTGQLDPNATPGADVLKAIREQSGQNGR